MEDNILVNLLDIYKPITDKDIKTAKNYVALRERTAHSLSSRIDDVLKDAAERITRICYQFNIDPQTFTLSSSYDKQMFEMVADILDGLEDEILDLTMEYATDCTEDKKRLSILIPWLLSLGKENKNLRQTLEKRIWIFSRDLEAMIAAMRYAKRKLTDAVMRIKSNLHTVYVTPEVLAAIRSKKPFQATYIKSGGIKKGNVGNSNSEANNIERFGEITVQMSWMRNLRMDYEEEGAEGFVVMRGSNYDCPLCDDHVGFHKIDEAEHFPPFHGHCCCIAIPVNKNEDAIPSKDKRQQEYQKYKNDKDYKDVEYNPENGGLKATHKDHKKHKNDEKRYFAEQLTGDELESEFQDKAFKLGHSVIFRAEANNKTDLDMILDGTKMDLVSVTSNSTIFNNQLGRKNEQLTKYNSLYDEHNNSVCMYFHNPSYYSYDKVKDGLEKLFSYGVDVQIKNIHILLNDGTDIFKLQFP